MIELDTKLLRAHTTKALLALGGNPPADDWLHRFMDEYSFSLIVAADRGAAFLLKNGYMPHFVVGDFDSLSTHDQHILEEKNVPRKVLPTHKDYTDAEVALHLIAEQHIDEVVLLGALGGRMDHEAALLTRVVQSAEDRLRLVIAAENQCLCGLKPDTYHISALPSCYYSVVAFSDDLTISYKGMQYPLQNALLSFGSAQGVSNEAAEKTMTIEVHTGKGLFCMAKQEPY